MYRDLGSPARPSRGAQQPRRASHPGPRPPDQAREQHAQALAIARDIGVPLEEARALEGLGQAYLHDGNTGEAAAHLRQALSIYQRIGAPAAQRVQAQLREGKLAWSGSRRVQTGAAGIAGADNL